MLEPPYYIHYSELRLMIHSMVTSKYFDLAISAVIGLNVITMAMEFYMMPKVKCILKAAYLNDFRTRDVLYLVIINTFDIIHVLLYYM